MIKRTFESDRNGMALKGCSKFWGSLLIVILPYVTSIAQTSDDNYRKPIAQTLQKIEDIFKVTIKDEDTLLHGKELDFADWRIRHGNLEVSLTNLLAPFDLTFFKESETEYIIRRFQYPRRSVAVGEERLDYLSGLYTDLGGWEKRKKELVACLYSSLALDQAPAAPDSKPVHTPKRNYKGYSIENVGLEIVPGVFVAASIYRPRPLKKKHPIILTPNGHSREGRYSESQQLRSATLAKMGAIVVGYDLFGWGESELQFPKEYHRSSMAGTMQVLNGMRILDYMTTLPEADVYRIGVTGASGGGSQTLFLTALDKRVKVAVPVVMVSSHFSGGCPCESGRPIHLCGNGTNNAEIAALAAPRPQLIVSDGKDWTHAVPDLEFPLIKRTYGFYGEEEVVKNVHFPEEGHDYGPSKRQAMYPFMAKHLGLDLNKVLDKNGQVDESGIVVEPVEKLLVFGKNGEKLPAHALKDIDKLYEMFGEENKKVYEAQ